MRDSDFHQEFDNKMTAKKERMASMQGGVGMAIQESMYHGAKVELPFKRFDKDLPALFKEDEGNAGFDLFARIDEPIILQPGETYTFPLNVATEIPVFAVGLVFQRSSTYRKWKIKLTNNVGVIDSTFRGEGDEWGAEFKNETTEPVTVNPGDKICQAVFLSLLPVVPQEKDNFEGREDRGGYGTSFNNVKDMKGE